MVSVGSQLTIPCVADGSPKPTIEWLKVGDENNSFGIELNFRSVGIEDAGYYECRAKNGLDKDLLARIKLDVLGK